MPMLVRAVIVLLLWPCLLAAQPVPPAPPTPARPPAVQNPAQKPPQKPPQKPAQKPPQKPKRPAAKPPVVAPVPAPAAIVPPEPEKPAEPGKGSNTGLPLPRFAALRSDEVYMRIGPGKRYPIDWVYKRRDLPVQIEREFEEWRLIRDPDGTKGWVNQATLVGRRTAVVMGGERMLRRDAKDDAGPVARLKPGVIVRLRACEAASDWCQAQAGDYRGWVRRSEIWGLLPGEAIQ